MKTKTTAFVFISFLSFMTSCKKEDLNQQIKVEKNCSISSTNFQGLNTFYEYDSLDRIISHSTNKYLYTNGKVTIILVNLGWTSTIIEIILNSEGNVISQTYKKTTVLGENWEQSTVISAFTYNSDQNLIKEEITTKTTISEQPYIKDTMTEQLNYEYQNDNLLTKQYSNSKGSRIIWNYSYTDLPNQLAELERKLYFKGKQSKNLIKTREEIKNGAAPILITYSYTFNPDGKLATMKSGESSTSRSFIWNCVK